MIIYFKGYNKIKEKIIIEIINIIASALLSKNNVEKIIPNMPLLDFVRIIEIIIENKKIIDEILDNLPLLFNKKTMLKGNIIISHEAA